MNAEDLAQPVWTTAEATAARTARPCEQRCLRCGREERAGGYCSFCRTAEYDLVYHVHAWGQGCPLGPSRDPLSAQPAALGPSGPPRADLPTRPTRGGTILGTFHHRASARPSTWPVVTRPALVA